MLPDRPQQREETEYGVPKNHQDGRAGDNSPRGVEAGPSPRQGYQLPRNKRALEHAIREHDVAHAAVLPGDRDDKRHGEPGRREARYHAPQRLSGYVQLQVEVGEGYPEIDL